MERRDIIELVREGMHYMDKAEQIRWHVLESHNHYEEAMSKLDKFRRRMVFVENRSPETLELVNAMMELEKTREEKKGLENKLKIYITASLSYVLSTVESLNMDSDYTVNQIAVVLRQAVMLIRSIRELNIDFGSIYAQAVRARIIVNYSTEGEKRVIYANVSRYLGQLINSLE